MGYLSKQYKAMGLTGVYKNIFLHSVKMAMNTADQNMPLTIGDLSFRLYRAYQAITAGYSYSQF